MMAGIMNDGGGGGSGGVPSSPVEAFLLRELQQRDEEIVRLRRQVLQLQCELLRRDDAAAPPPALPQIQVDGACPPPHTQRGNHHHWSAMSSPESAYSTETLPHDPVGGEGGSVHIRVVSPSPPHGTRGRRAGHAHDCRRREVQDTLPESRFVQLLLSNDRVHDRVLDYLGDCRAVAQTCTGLSDRVLRYCTVNLQLFKAWHALEAGVHNESAYENLDMALQRRRRRTHAKYARSPSATVALHAFTTTLRQRYNSIALNVNNPKCAFRNGPPGLRADENCAVRARGINVAVNTTLHSSTRPVNCANAFKWLCDRNVRMMYPRGAVPHMLAMLDAVKKLSIQPKALVIDVCLVKPKWFPAIDFIRDYANIILVPEIPSRGALEDGEAERIQLKFNRYLESFATAGQCVYVVLDQSIAGEVCRGIRNTRVNVLSLPLPEKEGPIGLREYPMLEIITLLDSVFDDDLTLVVPAERAPIRLPDGTAKSGLAPGAGGIYRYSTSQAFLFRPPPPTEKRQRERKHSLHDDDDGISDSSSYSISSVGSVGSNSFLLNRPTKHARPRRHLARVGHERRGVDAAAAAVTAATTASATDADTGAPAASTSPPEGSRAETTKTLAEEGGFTLSITTPPEDPPEPSRRASFESHASHMTTQSQVSTTTTTVAEEGGFTLSVTSAEPVEPPQAKLPQAPMHTDPQARTAAPACRILGIDAVRHVYSCVVDASSLEEHGLQVGSNAVDEQAFAKLSAVAAAAGVEPRRTGVLTTLRVVRGLLAMGKDEGGVGWRGALAEGGEASAAAGEGVHVDAAAAATGAAYHAMVVPVDEASQRFAVHLMAMGLGAAAEGLLAPDGSVEAAPEWVYIGPSVLSVCPAAALGAAVRAWAERGARVCMRLDSDGVLDFEGTIAPKLADVLPHVSLVFASHREVPGLAPVLGCDAKGATAVRDLATLLAKRLRPAEAGAPEPLAVICVKATTEIVAGPRHLSQHTFPTVSIALMHRPRTYCDDAFIGGFLAKHCVGKDVETCVKSGFRKVVASLREDFLA